nr:HlyD family type I secretion periplasmic adaptor subunit [Herbaspirillum rubrisubalbicans]
MDLVRCYWQIWRHFWQQRRQLSPPSLKTHEAEFLPAALAIQGRPVSPAGRWIALTMMSLVLVLFLWAVLGDVDVIANGQGKIIPSARTKTITAVEVATIKHLYVGEGQAVKSGELLIELDTRSSRIDAEKAKAEWQDAYLQAMRSRTLLMALESGHLSALARDDEVPKHRWDDAELHLRSQWADFESKRRRLDDEIRRYAQALPLVQQKAKDYADLLQTKDVAEHAWIEKEQQRIDLQGQLDDARNQRSALTSEIRKGAQDALSESLKVMATSGQDINRARIHEDLLRITSPIDGTVQQLTAHTVGAAVPAAQALMQIVPSDGLIEMEAFIENKDIGFVHAGQQAQVKLDTFEYAKYGTVSAKVTHISQDAIQDEKKGLLYSVKVELSKNTMNIDGRHVAFTPGMSGSVEIKTGSRRIIEYVLSPLTQHVHESFHER